MIAHINGDDDGTRNDYERAFSYKGEWEEYRMHMIKSAIVPNYPVGAQEDPGSMAHKKDCH